MSDIGGISEHEFPDFPHLFPAEPIQNSHCVIQRNDLLFRMGTMVRGSCEWKGNRFVVHEPHTLIVEVASVNGGVTGTIFLDDLRQVVAALTEYEKCMFKPGPEGMSGKTSTPCPDLSNAQ